MDRTLCFGIKQIDYLKSGKQLSTSSFYCSDCPNACGVMQINDCDAVIARWGDTCGKWGRKEG